MANTEMTHCGHCGKAIPKKDIAGTVWERYLGHPDFELRMQFCKECWESEEVTKIIRRAYSGK